VDQNVGDFARRRSAADAQPHLLPGRPTLIIAFRQDVELRRNGHSPSPKL
jgi:hypothetical protein